MNLPGYDAWKTETPEDEWLRRHRNLWCEDCEERRATNAYVLGRQELYLCEPCAEARDEDH
jgi:hypothetical protein